MMIVTNVKWKNGVFYEIRNRTLFPDLANLVRGLRGGPCPHTPWGYWYP